MKSIVQHITENYGSLDDERSAGLASFRKDISKGFSGGLSKTNRGFNIKSNTKEAFQLHKIDEYVINKVLVSGLKKVQYEKNYVRFYPKTGQFNRLEFDGLERLMKKFIEEYGFKQFDIEPYGFYSEETYDPYISIGFK